MLGYVRVSTREQADNGNGLAAQEHAIRQACDQNGWQLTSLYRDEGSSGKNLDRPVLQQALQMISNGHEKGLIVAKLDRLSRSVIDFALLVEWFDRVDARLVALDLAVDTSTAGGRLVANVWAAMAQWERETIAQRTKDGMAQVKLNGRPVSGPAVSDQPGLVELIRRLRDQGLTYRAICDVLNMECVPTLRGGEQWRPSALQTILGGPRRRRPRQPSTLPG